MASRGLPLTVRPSVGLRGPLARPRFTGDPPIGSSLARFGVSRGDRTPGITHRRVGMASTRARARKLGRDGYEHDPLRTKGLATAMPVGRPLPTGSGKLRT